MVSRLHQEIVRQLMSLSGSANREQSSASYTGSRHFFYGVSVPQRRGIIKVVIKDLNSEDLVKLCDNLFRGKSHEEKTMGAMILAYRSDVRALTDFQTIDAWLSELVGWAEIDTFCYNTFKAEEMLANWTTWTKFICALAHDQNINKRRAALVFLTHPTAKSKDERLHRLAFKLVRQLAGEKDILITKAISWLLRSQIDANNVGVTEYIKQYEVVLPKIAVRETRRKLLTGKKN